LLATGIANFLHVRADSLRWLKGTPADRVIRSSPVIRRRSGVKKFEVDLRLGDYRLASAALTIASVVFLSAETAGGGPLLSPLTVADLRKRLRTGQAYALNQPPWQVFDRNIAHIDVFELRRGRHPCEAVDALETLLGAH
jgi:hypothetical protein